MYLMFPMLRLITVRKDMRASRSVVEGLLTMAAALMHILTHIFFDYVGEDGLEPIRFQRWGQVSNYSRE